MNTIIINKILMHMLDFEHRKIFESEDFVELNETTIDYYRKKVEKTLTSSSMKEITVGSLHELLLRSDKMIESDEEFIKQARELTHKLYTLGTSIGDMPNCNVMIVDCYKDGERVLAIIKVNYRRIPMSVVEDGIVRITTQQVLPTMGAKIEEAIIINNDRKKLFIIEKKYNIDGKQDYYLNSQWLKGEENLTDTQKISTMKKVIKRMDDLYHISNGDVIPMMKQELQEKIDTHDKIKPLEIVKKVLEKDYQAQEESEIMMKEMGIGDEDHIQPFSISSLEKCKLVLDEDIEIILPVDEYLNGTHVQKVLQDDGNYSIVLKDINEVIVK